MIGSKFKLAIQKFLFGREILEFNLELFQQTKNPQLSLWDIK